MYEDAARTVRGWARDEVERCVNMPSSALFDCYHALNESTVHIFIIEIIDGHVTLCSKPKMVRVYYDRAVAYLQHIRAAVFGLRLTTAIAIDVDDLARDCNDFPMFSFQRHKNSRNLLLPDIETIMNNHYSGSGWAYPDSYNFEDKKDIAVFTGSTTGVDPIEMKDVVDPFPRLRAARFFRNNPRISFQLTSIVQTHDPKVYETLMKEGIGEGRVPWQDQLRCKLLLSMDGNGAALSRPFLSLASNSALVKYESDYEAYYFRYLVSGEHYISVATDADVLPVVGGDLSRHKPVAEAGRAFVEMFLTPSMFLEYTSQLIKDFARRYPQKGKSFTSQSSDISPEDISFSALKHRMDNTPFGVQDIFTMYKILLGREPDSLDTIYKILGSHLTLESACNLIRDSAEYRARQAGG